MAKQSQIIVRTEEDMQQKVKYIAWFKRKTMTEILTELIEKELKGFEKENGEITTKQLQDARIID